MDTTEINIWEHYGKPAQPRENLINRLRSSGPQKDGSGKFPHWEDCHIAADLIEHLERRVDEYEGTIRYLTLQLGKTL